MFTWNGKYYQLPMVNLWPRPIQQPHPPVWVPGTGSRSTWEFTINNNHCYCFLSYWGNSLGKRVMDGFWEFVATQEQDLNPYRAGFLQLVVVSETDARAEEEYFDHIRYFYNKSLHIPPEYFAAPGHIDFRSLENTFKKGYLKEIGKISENVKQWKYKDFIDNQLVIGGSPASVRDQLKEAVKKLRVGNLMVLLHIGSMPHELTLKNIDLFSKEVMPHLHDMWEDEGWENHWWPEKLKGKRKPAGVATS